MQSCSIENQRVWKVVGSVVQRGIDQNELRSDLSPMETGVILWLSANAIMTRMDTQLDYFQAEMNVNLEEVLRKSNALLLESLLTEEAKRTHRKFFQIEAKGEKIAGH